MTIDQLGLCPELLKAIGELGFVDAMPVQEQVIPYLTSHHGDLVALSQTGSGKTAAYGLPLLSRIDLQSSTPQALILTPTRELAVQVQKDLQSFAKYMKMTPPVALYGGASIEDQIRTLKRGACIAVATPGRLVDLLSRKALRLHDVQTIVLDEADIMLDMGFQKDLEEILSHLPESVEHWLFSATMNEDVRRIADQYIHAPYEVQIGKKNKANSDIKHLYTSVPARHKYAALKRIVDYYPDIYGIIFCRTRTETKEMAENLIRDGYNADALHGDLSQAQRDMVMQRFRIKNLQLLVATDVASRGLDVDNVTHVIHYGLPSDVESYTHRSGRTARAGKTGLSIAICHLRDSKQLRNIERASGIKIAPFPLPSGLEICSKQLFSFANKIEHTDSNTHGAQYDELLEQIGRKLSWIDPQELVRRIMILEADRLMRYYADTPDLTPQDMKEESRKDRSTSQGKKKRSDRNEGAPRKASRGMTRLFINLGKRDRLFPNKLIDLINQLLPYKIPIGKIELLANFSYFEVSSEWAQEVIDALSGATFGRRPITVDYANPME